MTTSDATPEPQSWDQVWDEDVPDETARPEPVEDEPVEESTPEVEAEAETEPDAATEDPPAPEAEADTDATEPVTEAGEEEPPAEEPTTEEAAPAEASGEPVEAQPFAFKAYGQDFAIDGATVVEEGGERVIRIPESAWQSQIHPKIADPSAIQRDRDRLERRIRELDPERNPNVVRAKVFREALDPLLEAAEKGDTGPLEEFLYRAKENARVLRAEAEKEVYRRQAEAGQQQRQQADQETLLEEVVPVLKQGLQEHVTAVLETDDFKGLGFDAEEVRDELWELFEAGVPVFIEVTPENRARFPGYEPGNYVNLEVVQRHLAPQARRLAKERKAREEAADRRRKAKEAEEANRRATGEGDNKPPTAVRATGSPSPERDAGEPDLESVDDWREWVLG